MLFNFGACFLVAIVAPHSQSTAREYRHNLRNIRHVGGIRSSLLQMGLLRPGSNLSMDENMSAADDDVDDDGRVSLGCWLGRSANYTTGEAV